MAVTAFFYDNFILSAFGGTIDFTSATVKCMLCTSSYTPNQATHDAKADVTNEVTGTAYTAGGEEVTSFTVTLDSHVVKFDGDNVSWAASTIANARYAVLYIDTGSAATSALIAFVNFGEDLSSLAADFNINWDDTGIATITVAS